MNDKFFTIIAGGFPQEIQNMIVKGSPITLSIKDNCVEGRHSIILDNSNQQYVIEAPALCPISGACTAAMQKAVCNQKNIDLWVNLLAGNIKFNANLFHCKSIVVNIQDIFIYKNHMFFSGHPKFDELYTYYVHPYMGKKYSAEEIREIISCQTNTPIEKIIFKTGIWNEAHYFAFDQFNVEYMQPEEDIF